MADVLKWTAAAETDAAWPLKYVPAELRERASREALAFEAHMYGVWMPDFWCAIPSLCMPNTDIDNKHAADCAAWR